MKLKIFLAVIFAFLGAVLFGWRADRTALANELSRSRTEAMEFSAKLDEANRDLANLQISDAKIAQDFAAFRGAKNKELASAGDDYVQLLELQEENKKLRAALVGNDTYDKQQAIILAEAQKSLGEWQQWGKQKNAEYDKLLGYYNEVCKRNTSTTVIVPQDTSIQYDQMGIAAKDFIPQSQPPPPTTQGVLHATVTDQNGNTSQVQVISQ